MSNFYLVQRNGIPAVWQAAPEGIGRLLKCKSKTGYAMALEPPMSSRSEALKKLHELFPNARRGQVAGQKL
jgi:hypothetical protein